MIKPPSSLQDLRKSLYVKAKAEPAWRFWGLYVHVCKMETLQEAYRMAKSNDGAPGIDGVTFEAIEESGVESFLKQIQDELVHNTYQPMRVRKKEIPKDGGTKVRVLSIPAIRDRVVQGALKLILEPIFEADFQSGSYGYRPKRTAQEAVFRVDQAIMAGKTRVIDLDLRAYFSHTKTLRPTVQRSRKLLSWLLRRPMANRQPSKPEVKSITPNMRIPSDDTAYSSRPTPIWRKPSASISFSPRRCVELFCGSPCLPALPLWLIPRE